MNGVETLNQVAKSTTSEIVLLSIVIAVVIMAISVPLYRMAVKSKKETLDQYIKREGMLMEVIKENSSAITELTTMIKNTNANCNACKVEQTALIQDVLVETRETRNLVDKATAILIERGHIENAS